MSYFFLPFSVLVLCCTVYTTWVEDRLTMYVTTVALSFPVRQGIIPVSGLCKLSGERGCSKLYVEHRSLDLEFLQSDWRILLD